MYEFWYDYLKPKYSETVKLCYMDTDSFTVHVKADDIAKDVEKDLTLQFMKQKDRCLKEKIKT